MGLITAPRGQEGKDMVVVRFVRKDLRPDEIYYYHTEAAAREHFNLFLDDDSDLYSVIRLESDCGKLIDCIIFSMVEVI